MADKLDEILLTDILTEGQLGVGDFVSAKDIMGILGKNGIRAVLVGGHAANKWRDSVRATQDVDIVVPHAQLNQAVEVITSTYKLKATFSPHVVELTTGSGGQQIDVIPDDQPIFKVAFHDNVSSGGVPVASAEAVLVMKYGAISSKDRSANRRDMDKADFNNICRTQQINTPKLKQLAMAAFDDIDVVNGLINMLNAARAES